MRLAAVVVAVGLFPAIAVPQDHEAQEPAGVAPRFTLRGFSNVDLGVPWGAIPPGEDARHGALALGQFDLYMSATLTDGISFLGETVFELNEDQETVVDVERLQIRYGWSDQFHLAAGRGHTALGYWNEAYHHGALLQPTVERPEALKFEDDGGILPVHFVGMEVSGHAPTGSWDWSYVVTAANGRGPRPDVIQGATDANKSKAFGVRLRATVGGGRSLSFGPAFYHDVIPSEPGVPGREGEIEETILGAHVVYRGAHFDLLSEYFHVRHEDKVTLARFEHQSAYAVGIARFGRWALYLGVDWLGLDAGDPFFSQGYADLTRVLVGGRYDLATFNCLKLEYQRDKRPWGVEQRVVLQSAFTF